MTPDAAGAALLLALAVTLHNIEEMIWLPRFRYPPRLSIRMSAGAFRIAAALIAALFWAAAIAVPLVSGADAIMAGFAAAMMVNAIVPHLALTVSLRRYHPGTATAWLAVVPAALLLFQAVGGATRLGDPSFVPGVVAGAVILAAALPASLLAGRAAIHVGDAAARKKI